MGCGSSKQRRCRYCRTPYSVALRTYSMHVVHPPQEKGYSCHVVYLNSLSYCSIGNVAPISVDAEMYARERASNVLLNVERQVRDQPIERPIIQEPSLITMEQYRVMKKLREEEMLRERAKAMAQGAAAFRRFQTRAAAEVKDKQFRSRILLSRPYLSLSRP